MAADNFSDVSFILLILKAPFIPELKNDWDTKYFDKFEETESFYPEKLKTRHRKVSKKFNNLNFFTGN